jgi:hypothetical protein
MILSFMLMININQHLKITLVLWSFNLLKVNLLPAQRKGIFDGQRIFHVLMFYLGTQEL